MDQGTVENPVTEEQAGLKPGLIDIFDEKYQIHLTQVRKLPSILKEGIISKEFGKRIHRRIEWNLRGRNKSKRYVYLGPLIGGIIRDDADFEGHYVGIIVKTAESERHFAPFRVSPRQFVGLLQPDVTGEDVVAERVQEILAICKKGKSLPINIYGRDGGLNWPTRKSHEEIIEEVRRGNEV